MDEKRLKGALALYRIFKEARDEDLELQADREARAEIAAALDALATDIRVTAHRLRGAYLH